MGVEVTLHWTDVYSPEHKIINEFTGLRENEDVEIPRSEKVAVSGDKPLREAVMEYCRERFFDCNVFPKGLHYQYPLTLPIYHGDFI